jgi:hypothetical protein
MPTNYRLATFSYRFASRYYRLVSFLRGKTSGMRGILAQRFEASLCQINCLRQMANKLYLTYSRRRRSRSLTGLTTGAVYEVRVLSA